MPSLPPLLHRAVNASIWGPNAIGDDDDRVRSLLRVALPAVDIALALFGAGALAAGVPALRDVFDPIYARAWAGVIGLAAVACLVGLAFPAHLWRLERGAKAALMVGLVVYGVALIYAGGVTGDVGRSAVGFVPVALVPVLLWRIFDVTKDARKNGWKGAPA